MHRHHGLGFWSQICRESSQPPGQENLLLPLYRGLPALRRGDGREEMNAWFILMIWSACCFIFGSPPWGSQMQPDTYAILMVLSAFAAQVARKLNL